MSESNSRLESQLNYFNEQKNLFINSKIIKEEETTKEDEEIMEINKFDEMNNFDKIRKFNDLNRFEDLNKLNESKEVNQINELSQLNQLDQLNQINLKNETNEIVENSIDQLKSTNKSTIDQSSPLINKLQSQQVTEQSTDLKQDQIKHSDSQLQNQQFISSLNNFMQQQNNQFSQVNFGLFVLFFQFMDRFLMKIQEI